MTATHALELMTATHALELMTATHALELMTATNTTVVAQKRTDGQLPEYACAHPPARFSDSCTMAWLNTEIKSPKLTQQAT